MPREADAEVIQIGGREVTITHPGKLYFSRETQLTKLELVRYYLAVAEGALGGIRDRPIVLKRFVNGADAPPFYQKRAPENHPAWVRTVMLSFPSGRTADELVIDDAAGLAWMINLGNIELHPHPVRTQDLEHPDELRIDHDPGPGVVFRDVIQVSLEVQALLGELGLQGFAKTSGSRGMHVLVRIVPRWSFTQVRRAALALSREIERRAPTLATSKWWKEERHGVFLDYNQNAKDRTTCSAYSVRPLPDARVSAPLSWSEVPDCNPADFTVKTMPARFAQGDPHREIDASAGSLAKLLELAERDEAQGLGDAPWPPHFEKAEGEGPRVAPSRAKKTAPAKRRSAKKNQDASPSETVVESTIGETAGAAPAKRRGRKIAAPLITVANSPDKEAAFAGLQRWKDKHPQAAALLAIDDVLIDSMRGRSTSWTRIRVNLRHIPETERPAQETPDPDDDPTRAWRQASPGDKT